MLLTLLQFGLAFQEMIKNNSSVNVSGQDGKDIDLDEFVDITCPTSKAVCIRWARYSFLSNNKIYVFHKILTN